MPGPCSLAEARRLIGTRTGSHNYEHVQDLDKEDRDTQAQVSVLSVARTTFFVILFPSEYRARLMQSVRWGVCR